MSYHAKHRVTESDLFDNRLIFGDNLLALKALEAEFAGRVKCVFIDPPYNTGHAANVGTKPWKYLLVPHDEIRESWRLSDFLRFEQKST
ncbi:hypothetical protein PG2T_00250 [Immundisolibacter cernigliae]|uniref:DNA methylase N-4/N-6 domain-containing protein n=1 Tax=Immundisolibacter cernigliae TaxID=1810504 RepID=A0A1B1YPR5_9GAMM|nr:hypothetical protein PG2T_00250 [Immundisolibacter cernigliae]